MVTVYTHHVTNIRIKPFGKNCFFIPKLPPRYFHQGKQAQFVTSIHKSRINHVMCANHLHSRITQLFGITPLERVGQGITQDCKILMAVCSHQFSFIAFSVDPQAVRLPKLNAANTDTLTITVDDLTFRIFYQHVQIIQIRRFRTP